MTRNETLILTIFDRALRAGEDCPNNNQLCEILGYASTSSASTIVSNLEAAGMITVVHLNRTCRRIAMTDAGRAWLATRPEMNGEATALTAIGDTDARDARAAANASNDAFLAAMRRVRVPPEPPARREAPLRMLPPPSLTSEAFS